MPWHDILPDCLNPWAEEQPRLVARPLGLEVPPLVPLGEGGGLAEGEPERKRGSDVLYLGLNDPSRPAEIEALPEGAHVADGSARQGKVMSLDGETEFDLTKEEDVRKFLADAGVAARRKGKDGAFSETEEQATARLAALEEVFLGKEKDGRRVTSGMAVSVRDEMAELVQHMQKAENGEIDVKRMIISGHHYPGEQGIHGDNGGMRYAELNAIMNHFQGTRDGMEDLMLSACNTVFGTKQTDTMYQKMFPGLESVWGYAGIAPAPGADPRNSSPAHIRAWEEASRGDDPAAVEEAARGRFRVRTSRF